MTTPTDSAGATGTQGSQPAGSQGATGQQNSQPEYITLEQYNKLAQQFETLSRQLQSDKDRAVKKVGEKVDKLEGDLMQVLQAAKAGGKSIDELIDEQKQAEEADFRNVMKTMAQAFATGKFPQSTSFGNGEQSGVDVSAVAKELELPAEDLRVKDFLNKSFASKEAALLEGAKLIKTISRQPTDADRPAGESGRTQSPTQIQQLQAEYDEKAKKAFGQALINLKMEYRKKGLRIS